MKIYGLDARPFDYLRPIMFFFFISGKNANRLKFEKKIGKYPVLYFTDLSYVSKYRSKA